VPSRSLERRSFSVFQRQWNVGSQPRARACRWTITSRATRGRASVSIVHCPLIPPTPISHFLVLLSLLLSHSLSFCKQHLYGSYAFAGRKVAFYSPCLLMPSHPSRNIYRRKTGTTLRGKKRVRLNFLRARLGILTKALEKECAIKQCRARINAPVAGIALITYVRPTSDSEAEETKGDILGAMAPPPVPPAKKVRSWFELSPCVNAYSSSCLSWDW
jgi:hypothetical protein